MRKSLAVLSKHANFALGFEGAAPPTGIDYSDLSTQIKASPNILPAPLA